jgi:hypothetical protein
LTDQSDYEGRVSAIKTYRYLRLAMVVLVVGIFAAIYYASMSSGGFAIKPSISHYYYSSARDMFVAALLAIGVCLVCIRGGTATEDAFLNIAGLLAMIVAVVPVSEEPACFAAAASPAAAAQPVAGAPGRAEVVSLNFHTLMAIGVFAAAILIGLTIWTKSRGQKEAPPTAKDTAGFLATLAVAVAFAVLFHLYPNLFLSCAHNAAAVGMFTCIALVAGIDGIRAFRKQKARKRGVTYVAIAAAMPLAAFGIYYVNSHVHQFSWATFLVDATLISLFAIFWFLQTIDLWQVISRDQAIAKQRSGQGTDSTAPSPELSRLP